MGDSERRRERVLAAAVIAAAVAVAAFLALITVPSADDWPYRAFLRRGVAGYFSAMRNHYMTLNGRMFVHFLASVVLNLGNWFFALVCVAELAAASLALSRAAGLRRREELIAGALFCALFLAAPYSVISSGVLWISANFNYVFPTALLCAALLLQGRFERSKRRQWLIYLPFSFLLGATTEQTGACAILMHGYFFVRSLIRRDGLALRHLSAGIAGLAGLATLLLSPNAQLRARGEFAVKGLGGLADKMYLGLQRAAPILGESVLFGLLTAALAVLAGLAVSRRMKKRLPLWVGVALAAPALLMMFIRDSAALLLAVSAISCAAGLALILSGGEFAGLAVLLGFASMAMMLPSESVAGRTLTPLFILLAVSVSVLAAPELLRAGRLLFVLLPALLLLGLLTVSPVISGFLYNYDVDRDNAAAAAEGLETGTIYYRLDYDYRYTEVKLDTLAYFSDAYLELLGTDAGSVRLRFISRTTPNVYVNGELTDFPSIMCGGKTVLALRSVLEAAGGEIVPVSGYDTLRIIMPWGEYTAAFTGDEALFSYVDGDGELRDLRTARYFERSRNFVPPEVFSEVFGMEAELTDSGYHFTTP